MIEINLLPGAGKKKAAAKQSVDFAAIGAKMGGGFKDKFMIAAVVGVVAGAGAAGYLFWSQSRLEKTLDAHKEKAVADSARYANFLRDRYKSEAVRDTLLRQVNIIKSLDGDRYIWPHIMDEVSRALPQYTWISALAQTGTPQGVNTSVVAPPKTPVDTTKKGKAAPPKRMDTAIPLDVVAVQLNGKTVDIEALTRFMRDLEASPFLSGVALDHSELVVDQGKPVTQFQLKFNYNRPDSTILNRVPLALSVR